MRFFLFAFSLFFILTNTVLSQVNNYKNEFKYLHYLEGNWVIETEDRNFYEQWELENDSLLISKSFYVKNGDTTNTETVRLEIIDDYIYYIPTVEHNAGPIRFKLTSLTETMAIFENPAHDFPTKIIYEKINNDSLIARIEGLQKGKLKRIDYPFKREK